MEKSELKRWAVEHGYEQTRSADDNTLFINRFWMTRLRFLPEEQVQLESLIGGFWIILALRPISDLVFLEKKMEHPDTKEEVTIKVVNAVF